MLCSFGVFASDPSALVVSKLIGCYVHLECLLVTLVI